MAITTGIVGAAGFAGIELVRLVLRHPDLELSIVTSNELAGTAVASEYPGFVGATDLAFASHDDPALDTCELVFLAVPHTAALGMAPRLVAGGSTVIDLSADFRLKDPVVYEQWYAARHTAVELLEKAAFGLPELFPDDLVRAAAAHKMGEGTLVACAGCYPTATSLAAAPAVRAGWVAPGGVVVADAVSGVTGAGKKASARTHFCFADENLEAYGVATHRHTPEIEQILELDGRLVFTLISRRSIAGCSPRSTFRLRRTRLWMPPPSSNTTAPSTATARSCTCSVSARCLRPRRLRARTTLISGSPSTNARACLSRCALSTTWEKAQQVRPFNVQTRCFDCPRAPDSTALRYPCDASRPLQNRIRREGSL